MRMRPGMRLRGCQGLKVLRCKNSSMIGGANDGHHNELSGGFCVECVKSARIVHKCSGGKCLNGLFMVGRILQ
jgi:hypothetical protein